MKEQKCRLEGARVVTLVALLLFLASPLWAAKNDLLLAPVLQLHLDFVQQTTRPALNQVQYALEAMNPAIVRIWYVNWAFFFAKLQQQPDLAPMLLRATGQQIIAITVIHGNQVVEAVEVVHRNLPRALRSQVNAPSPGGSGCPLVRLVAHMIGMSTRRIYVYHVIKASLRYQLLKNTLRGWRPAYIAHADE